jgi:(p)ppGpp synthase/HD superfamily hydrolase
MPSTDPDPPFIAGLPVTRAAVAFAGERHGSQRRQVDAAPFILHPLEVAMLLHGRGYADEVVAAGALHDVLEKTDTTADELATRFGTRVAGLVETVSDPAGFEDYDQRKAALRDQVARASPEAQAIFAADKLAKSRELRGQVARRHVALSEPTVARRLRHYERSLAMLERQPAPSPLVNQLRFELWALHRLPPGE